MLHFLGLTTSTLFMAALVFGLFSGYVRAGNLFEIRPWLRAGCLSGLAVAAALALLELATGWVVREYYDLGALLTLIFAELCLFVHIAADRALSPEQAATFSFRGISFIFAAALGAFCLPDIFIYPSHFAVGVVNVVSSEFIFIVAGYCLGLALCLLVGYAVHRVAAALPTAVLTPFLLVALAVFLLSLMLTTAQILLGRGLVPRADFAVDAVILLLNYTDLFLCGVAGASGLVALTLLRRAVNEKMEGENPAVLRRARSLARARAKWSAAAIVMLCSGILVLTVGMRFDAKKAELVPPVPMPVSDGAVHIPLALVGDGKLHRFVYAAQNGVAVRYIVIKKSETAYGVGLDACDICGPSGYFERKGQVVCILCDVVMNRATIGFAGGCNPVPVKFAVRDGAIVIDAAILEAEAPRFM
ncbi:MAG: DUF2318 domain-containing protein [Desulfovibrio sp.]|jgi:uncharacterized membrane protein|nr:DUF2318 domain-containing protein [Desulfovibrio sp.]